MLGRATGAVFLVLSQRGWFHLAYHQYFLVLGPAQRGVPLHHVDLPLDPPLNFLENVCNDRFNADSLKISCTPTEGSAVVGETVVLLLLMLLTFQPLMFYNSPVTILPQKYRMWKIVEQLLSTLKCRLAVVIRTSTIILSFLPTFMMLDSLCWISIVMQ